MVIPAETTPAVLPEPLHPSAAFSLLSRRGSLQSSLHNFDSSVLKTWGSHRVLRCLHVNRKGENIAGYHRSGSAGASTSFSSRIPQNDDHASNEDGGFKEVKPKLLVYLREAADRINKVPVPNSKSSASVSPPPAAPEPLSGSKRDIALPWNLRTRRMPANKEPRSSDSPPPPPASERSGGQGKSAARLRSDSLEKHDWPKISIPLSRKEIEEDIFAITGSRPCRRPKKRPRIQQRQLDLLLPGSWLPFMSSDAYRVPDST